MLHDPVQYDHLPYLPFPPNWPTYTPKDKLGDWLEFYASALELNVWTSATISAASFDEHTRTWSVTVARPSGPRQLQPRHIVLATGHSGEPHMPAGLDLSPFAGDVICHSSAFPGAKQLGAGQRRKAVVVGCCNSAHDIAHSYFENGYDVTLVQRSSTYVMSSADGIAMLMKGLYDEDGVTIGLPPPAACPRRIRSKSADGAGGGGGSPRWRMPTSCSCPAPSPCSSATRLA